jgi:DNA-binding MarR family transcriptional regulator
VVKPSYNDELPDHIARWIEAITKRLYSELARRPWDYADLRGSHRRLLQMVPPGGVRITDLANLAGMTKQALGDFVDSLEEAGMVVSDRQSGDRRVRLVRRTRLGDEVAESSAQAIEAVEQGWRAEVGVRRYEAMKQVIRELGADSFKKSGRQS